jgi:uncharacterized protein (TIGR02270 family)
MKPLHVLAGASLPVALVVTRHTEEAALLCNQRLYLVQAPHVKLHQLRRLDDRLAAHLDGLFVAADAGSKAVEAALAEPGRGEVFTAAALALDNKDSARLARIFAISQALPQAQDALVLAVGWVSAQSLRDINGKMLASPVAFHRAVGLAACALHRVDPGESLVAAVEDSNAALRSRALRVAGDCGRRDLLPNCIAAQGDADATCRFNAARAALLLGERQAPVHTMHEATHLPGVHRSEALSLLLKISTPEQAAPLLKTLLDKPDTIRDAIRGAGTLGDPRIVPWLIAQMDDLKLARIAGEAFSTITGLDLAWLDLERKPPEGVEFGPNDDPLDDKVDIEEDDGLPWPDPSKLHAWWSANSQGFQSGVRHFMGASPSLQHCRQVLKDGYQRQRIAAAEYLCLLQPGTPLFPTSAPAWRQQRWLNEMK